MHRFSRMHLSAADALRNLDAVDLGEKAKLAEGLALIAVVDHRRDYLAAGYSCMRDYCVGRLRMSEDKAFRRIQVARAALRFPALFEFVADGRLSVTTACVLVPHLTEADAGELLAAAAFKSRAEIVQLLAKRTWVLSPMGPAPSAGEDVQSSSGSLAPVQVNSLADRGGDSPEAPVPAGVAGVMPPPPPRRGRVTPAPAGGFDVRLNITPGEHDALRRAQALLSHAVPSGDLAEVYARAIEHYVAHLERRRWGARRRADAKVHASGGSTRRDGGRSARTATLLVRHIPAALRREVWERDGGCCAFVSADGHRCNSTCRLQFDHIVPLAHGGGTASGNLRLLCRAHNQFEARRVLGEEHVRARRERAELERARERAAKAAAGRRSRASGQGAAARATEDRSSRANSGPGPHMPEAATRTAEPRADVAPDESRVLREDLRTALRGLGFSVAECLSGAAVADSMPGASLESCLRAALRELTRAVVMRGERAARCSA